ncbi:hypothetical protein Lalb_Chr13g0290501 [Lupinus albus]|uniref:Uncharacterized protein n=1 Tax=Lupinus albus TaxID=3870 RepID=A0A6A4PHA5_LUPAL|nr:hypothetical protein Lalb_Chr13g0290501 [Lupinus albus]
MVLMDPLRLSDYDLFMVEIIKRQWNVLALPPTYYIEGIMREFYMNAYPPALGHNWCQYVLDTAYFGALRKGLHQCLLEQPLHSH